MKSSILKGTTPLRLLVILATVAFAFSVGAILLFVGKTESLPNLLKAWLLFFLLGIATPLAGAGFVLMVQAFGSFAKNLFVMLGEIEQNVGSFYWKIGFNPVNVVFFPRYLTEDGLEARRKVIRAYLMFFAYILFWIPLILMMEFWNWS